MVWWTGRHWRVPVHSREKHRQLIFIISTKQCILWTCQATATLKFPQLRRKNGERWSRAIFTSQRNSGQSFFWWISAINPLPMTSRCMTGSAITDMSRWSSRPSLTSWNAARWQRAWRRSAQDWDFQKMERSFRFLRRQNREETRYGHWSMSWLD